MTKLDDLSPIIFLNRTKAALNCGAGSMQVILCSCQIDTRGHVTLHVNDASAIVSVCGSVTTHWIYFFCTEMSPQHTKI